MSVKTCITDKGVESTPDRTPTFCVDLPTSFENRAIQNVGSINGVDPDLYVTTASLFG